MLDIMLDLETLGTAPDACILSIGAVKFDPNCNDFGVGVEEFFEAHIDPTTAIERGGAVDGQTVMWWLSEDRAAARRSLLNNERMPIDEALCRFRDWVGASPTTDVKVWGCSASFDNVILREAYRRSNIFCPWHWWNDRCYRTMKTLHPRVPMDRQGIHHSAVDDARSQAVHLQRILLAAKQ